MASGQDGNLWKSEAVHPLSRDQVKKIADTLHLECSPEDISQYTDYIPGFFQSYQKVYELVEPTFPVKYPRTPGYRPQPEENPLNAWYYKCDIKGATTGKLAGKRVGIKDNTAVAGVPMMNGSKILEGYVPEFDATVVTRILDAGGNIVGKTACEDLCYGGGGFNNSLGPVLNPTNKEHLPGASSSGSGALVAAGEVDLATGGDQGGSIRIPASWCGIVGLKPTWSLVPYTGVMSLEMTLDHTGPMARTVKECALFLEVLAGYDDGNDPRQSPNIEVPEYSKLLRESLEGVRVAVLLEAYEGCEPDVVDMVRKAAYKLEQRGAVVKDASLPIHRDAVDIWTPVATEGAYQTMIKDDGHTVGWKGQHFTSMLDKMHQGYSTRARDFSEIFKVFMIIGEYMKTAYHGRFYAKAQNLARHLTNMYDALLKDYDVMIMPTVPYKAPKLPTKDTTLIERANAGLRMVKNTAPFDVTGHPALSISVGNSQGLPVGMQIVGRKFDDLTVLQVAHVFECIREQQ